LGSLSCEDLERDIQDHVENIIDINIVALSTWDPDALLVLAQQLNAEVGLWQEAVCAYCEGCLTLDEALQSDGCTEVGCLPSGGGGPLLS
jgi:hypothetical protein